jgi:translation initiation factor IF-3
VVAEEKEPRVNSRIRAREVRLVGADGAQLGVVPVFQALHLAEEAGLDLVEVAPLAQPPVCRIMDYGKFKYQRKKRQQEARKRQIVVLLKEVKIRYKTDEHDLQTKVRQASEFLKEGHKVKFVMFFKGREIQFAALGQQVMEKVAADLLEFAVLERPPRMEGRLLAMYLTSKGVVKKEERNAEDSDE